MRSEVSKENMYLIKEGENFEERAFLLIHEIGNTVLGAKILRLDKEIPTVSDVYLISYSKEQYEQYKVSKYEESLDCDLFYKEKLKYLKEHLENIENKLKTYNEIKYKNLIENIEKISSITENTLRKIKSGMALSEKDKNNKLKSIKQLSKRYRRLIRLKSTVEKNIDNLKKNELEKKKEIEKFISEIKTLKETNQMVTPEKIFGDYFK